MNKIYELKLRLHIHLPGNGMTEEDIIDSADEYGIETEVHQNNNKNPLFCFTCDNRETLLNFAVDRLHYSRSNVSHYIDEINSAESDNFSDDFDSILSSEKDQNLISPNSKIRKIQHRIKDMRYNIEVLWCNYNKADGFTESIGYLGTLYDKIMYLAEFYTDNETELKKDRKNYQQIKKYITTEMEKFNKELKEYEASFDKVQLRKDSDDVYVED